MTLELIGLFTLLAGFLTLRKGPDFGIVAMMIATLLGAAAAVKLPALGGANIQPAHALLPFYCLAVLQTKDGLARSLTALTFPRPGFWLAVFVLYGAITAIFLPRIFEGATEVFSIGQFNSSGRLGIIVSALRPSNSHITQSVYQLGNLALFAAIASHILDNRRTHVVTAILVAGAVNILFAFLDVATYATGTADILSIIRNSNYGILAENSIGGFKRIVGSFTEASSFGGFTTYFFVFSTELWLRGYRMGLTGSISAVSFLLIAFSTSSSTYLGAGIYCAFLFARCLAALLHGSATIRHAVLALSVPVGIGMLLTTIMLIPPVWDAVTGLFESTLLNKLNSQSAVERQSWNVQAMQSFMDTYMLGAGVGSVRTSSFAVALLANVGIFGTLVFVAFVTAMAATIWNASSVSKSDPAAVAAAWACVVALVPAAVAGTSVDLGLIFHALAAVAASIPLANRIKASAVGVQTHWQGLPHGKHVIQSHALSHKWSAA